MAIQGAEGKNQALGSNVEVEASHDHHHHHPHPADIDAILGPQYQSGNNPFDFDASVESRGRTQTLGDFRLTNIAAPQRTSDLNPQEFAHVMQNYQFRGTVEALGVGIERLARAHYDFIASKAEEKGQSIGEFLRGETDRRGYGGSKVEWWPSLSPAEQQAWHEKFDEAVALVRQYAPEDVIYSIDEAEKAGGGIVFEQETIERLNAYAFRRGNILGVGRAWIEHALTAPELVYANISHELGGHLEYGDTVSWTIMSQVLQMLPPEELEIAKSGGNSLHSSYSYMETELYAELREVTHRIPGSGGDAPSKDVPRQLRKIQEAFPPMVATAVVHGIRHRAQNDPRVSDEAKVLLDKSIQEVFDISFRAPLVA